MSPKNGYFFVRETPEEPERLTKKRHKPAMYFEVAKTAAPEPPQKK
jgi:hypothetical protein